MDDNDNNHLITNTNTMSTDRERDRGRDRRPSWGCRSRSPLSRQSVTTSSIAHPLNPQLLESLGVKGPLSNRIVVDNLDNKVGEHKLSEIFKLAGKVTDVKLYTDATGNSKGHGTVQFEHPVEAVQAISMFHNQKLYDKVMTVRIDPEDCQLEPEDNTISQLPDGLETVGKGLGIDGQPLNLSASMSQLTPLSHLNTTSSNITVDQPLSTTPIRSSLEPLGVLSPDYELSLSLDSSSVSKSETDAKTADQKKKLYIYHVCQELCQTETNYVTILKDILLVFREPLKDHKLDDNYPNEIELKTIFGYLPPIIEVHEEILKKLKKVLENWGQDNDIGKIFVQHSQQFLTAYPQYINFHENTKEMIETCIEKYTKFKDFLKASQLDSRCNRQTLKEMLINPIQRLPRVELYLKALLEKTDEKKSEYHSLKEALNTIVEVNKLINKGKEKTEVQMKMFDMLNDIESCPPTLLSSQRYFIANCDARLLVQNDSHEAKEITRFENYLFTFLLFNDLLVLCKKRTLKRSNSLSVRGSSNAFKKSAKKSYKYIDTIELLNIKYIINDESEEYGNCFAIITYPFGTDRSFPTYPFEVKTPEFNRQKFLNHITDTILSLNANMSQENIIQSQNFKGLDFTLSCTIARSVSKSKYTLYRAKEKINRTLSMRTRESLGAAISLESLHVPSQSLPPSSPSSTRRSISRVFSSFRSPISRNMGRHLGSMTSLNENVDIEVDPKFSLPTTPAPRKRNKCSTNTEHNLQI